MVLVRKRYPISGWSPYVQMSAAPQCSRRKRWRQVAGVQILPFARRIHLHKHTLSMPGAVCPITAGVLWAKHEHHPLAGGIERGRSAEGSIPGFVKCPHLTTAHIHHFNGFTLK